ncbi:MAG: hypothetical protein KDA44_10510 [Planctomycetales bacterium]|nr:hypothetical protein [Planctomycetales bacterium]
MLGSHIVFSCYGFWLPNDPRGSGSRVVRAQHLYDAGGEATRVDSRRSVAKRPHDRAIRLATKAALARRPVVLTGEQACAVARGIADLLPRLEAKLHALAVLPDHVHAVAAPHRLTPAKLRDALKRAATRGLNDAGLHPFRDHARSNGKLPSPWAEQGWCVFLDTPDEMRGRIRYVEQNPGEAGLNPQRWSCVTPYAG